MTDLFEEPDEATPLTPDERKGLIPSDITYRSELNRAEQDNIARAHDWALSRRRNVLTEKFVKGLRSPSAFITGSCRSTRFPTATAGIRD